MASGTSFSFPYVSSISPCALMRRMDPGFSNMKRASHTSPRSSASTAASRAPSSPWHRVSLPDTSSSGPAHHVMRKTGNRGCLAISSVHTSGSKLLNMTRRSPTWSNTMRSTLSTSAFLSGGVVLYCSIPMSVMLLISMSNPSDTGTSVNASTSVGKWSAIAYVPRCGSSIRRSQLRVRLSTPGRSFFGAARGPSLTSRSCASVSVCTGTFTPALPTAITWSWWMTGMPSLDSMTSNSTRLTPLRAAATKLRIVFSSMRLPRLFDPEPRWPTSTGTSRALRSTTAPSLDRLIAGCKNGLHTR
eukprot:Opistho-1_new@6737